MSSSVSRIWVPPPGSKYRKHSRIRYYGVKEYGMPFQCMRESLMHFASLLNIEQSKARLPLKLCVTSLYVNQGLNLFSTFSLYDYRWTKALLKWITNNHAISWSYPHMCISALPSPPQDAKKCNIHLWYIVLNNYESAYPPKGCTTRCFVSRYT